MSQPPSPDDAEPPSFGPAATDFVGRAPAATSRRGPNDVRVKPANPDVISDLLDSFDIISADNFPSPIGPSRNVSRPRTPTRLSRPVSRSSQLGPARPPSSRPSNLTHKFDEVSHSIEAEENSLPDMDAAQPPVIRTARPPSGFSKMTAFVSAPQQSAIRRKLSSPRLVTSPPSERVMNNTAPASQRSSMDSRRARAVKASREGSRSPTRLQAVRESQVMPSDDYSLTGPVPPSSYKGKERQTYTPRGSSMRSGAYDMQRAAITTNGDRLQSQRSRNNGSFSLKPSQDDDEQVLASVDVPRRAPSRRRIIDDDSPTVGGQSETNGRTPSAINGRKIPERRSSALSSDSSSPEMRRSSFDLTQSPPDIEHKPDVPSSTPLPNRVILNDDSDNDETTRRIAQLRAAKEQKARMQRSGSLAADSTPAQAEAPRSLTMPSREANGVVPKRSRQLKEASEVKEHRISDEIDRKDDNYTLDVPPIVIAPSKPMAQPMAQAVPNPDIINKPFAKSSRPTTNGSAKTSIDIANKHSRQDSWSSKRWGPAMKSDGPRKSTDTRPGTSRGQTGFDTSRGSLDLVQTDVDRYLASPRLTQRIRLLGENRRVVFSEVGDPKGHAVLCCVGMGLTRYIMAFYDELATTLGLRLITLDRPGIGESDPYPNGARTPMSWPDDVLAVCEHLDITKFSLLAHSAGAVYALATALRLPQYLRGKIHLLAPWIPPSQLVTPTNAVNSGRSNTLTAGGSLPKSQRFLRMLPSSFLRLGNTSFGLNSRSSSPKPSKSDTKGRSRRSTETGSRLWSLRSNKHPEMPSNLPSNSVSTTNFTEANAPTASDMSPPTPSLDSFRGVPTAQHNIAAELTNSPTTQTAAQAASRQRAYDSALTPAIWRLATSNANPSVDLLICLERHRAIGFSYSEVGAKPAVRTLGERPGRYTSSGFPVDRESGYTGAEVDGNQWPGMGVVISHGTKDSRVPLENVRWLGGRMVRCEVRELEGLGHGLMGEAGVMGGVLKEIAGEWERNEGWVKNGRR